jgi:protocatechuate 3,4-dioxygenase beta subunit
MRRISLAKCKPWVALLWLIAYPVALLEAQSATGSVTGNVLCNDGNFPARGAKVELIPLDRLLPGGSGSSASSPAEAVTDFNGSYEIWSVNPGTYILNATLDGYSDDLNFVQIDSQHSSADDKKSLLATLPQVTVKAGSILHKDLVLRRAASISGRVSVDLGGTPGKISVTATLVSETQAGAASNISKENSVSYSKSALTDDRGSYRIAGLLPGKYRLSARITESYYRAKISGTNQVTLEPRRPGVAELTVFAPDALEEAVAQLMEVKDGDEVTDIDITVPARRLHSIEGTVYQDGAPAGGIIVGVKLQGGPSPRSNATTMPNGFYRFDLLLPGSYAVTAEAPNSQASTKPPAGTKPSTGKIAVLLSEGDITDANIDIRNQLSK